MRFRSSPSCRRQRRRCDLGHALWRVKVIRRIDLDQGMRRGGRQRSPGHLTPHLGGLPRTAGYAMSHFLDRLTFFKRAGRHLRQRPRHRHGRAARLGGQLSRTLAARQNRALHPRGELHRLVLLEDLRQGRHRHLGDPADRLPAHTAGSAQPRAAWLRARRQLLLVSLLGQPREAPDGARAPAQAVARGAGDALARRGLGLDRREARRSARATPPSAAWAAWSARRGTRSTRSSPPPTPTRSRNMAPTA